MTRNKIIPWLIAVSLALISTAGCRVETTETITPAKLVSLSVQPSSPSLAPGTNLKLEAIGTFDNGATKNVTSTVVWRSIDPAVANVDDSGLVTAANAGSTTITVTLSSVSGSTAVAVSPLVSIAVSPADPTIASGTSIGFTATGTLLNGSVQELTSFMTWTSSNTAVANVTGSGIANAFPSIRGSTTITALFGNVSGTTLLTSAALTSITITPLTATIALGTTQQYIATGGLAGGFTQDLTSSALWSSLTPTVASIGSGSASPGRAVSASPGSTVITASFVDITTITSNAAVLTVQPATLVSLSVTPVSSSIAAGSTQQFTATGTFSDGTTQDVTASATWASSNSQVLSVSNAEGTKGLASALAVGTASVSASFSGITSNSAAVSVTTSALVSISVSPANQTVSVNAGGVQFTATGTFSDGTTQNLTSSVTWGASSGLVFISNAAGSKGQVTLTGPGTVTITATFGSVSGSTNLTITPF